MVDCCYQYDHSFWCIGYAGFLDESYLHFVDPTRQKKTANPVAAPAPAAAPAAVAAPVQDDSEVIAVIAAAVAALGHSAEDIAYVRRLPEAGWTQNARIEAISVRKECF